MARVNGDPKYKSYREGHGLHKPFEELLKASGVDLSNGGFFKNFDTLNSTFRITKLLCLVVCTLRGSCLAEIPSRPRNCTSYMIGTLGTIM